MKKAAAIFIVIYFTCFNLKAQSFDTNNDGPAIQEEASQYNQSLNSSIDLSTGAVSSSIHLMAIDGGNGSLLNLNLRYQGNKGMKVNDVAGPFGTGFHLKGGGFIKRIVRGIADEKEWGVTTQVQIIDHSDPGFININTNDIGWLQLSSLGLISQSPIYYRSLLAPNGVTQATWDNQVKLYYKLVYSNNRNQNNTKLDGEPDIFQFEFGNFRGSFVFGNDRIPVMIPYQNIKIEVPYSFDKNGGISSSDSWIFTTPDGTKYEFINSSDYTENAPKGYTSAIHGAMSFDYISQWNLSSITTIDDNIYNFSYENDNIINISSIKDYMQFAISGEPGSIGPEDFSVTVQNDISIKRLTQNSSSFGRINFYKSLTPRLDFTNQYSVSSIKKYNNN